MTEPRPMYSVTLPLPDTVRAGDWLIMAVDKSAEAVTVPVGWVEREQDDPEYRIFEKLAEADEPAHTITTATADAEVGIAAVRMTPLEPDHD